MKRPSTSRHADDRLLTALGLGVCQTSTMASKTDPWGGNPPKEREVAVLYRCSVEDKESLKRRAAEAGVTLQTYLERVLFGRDVQDRASGPRPKPLNQDVLILPDFEEAAVA